MEPEVQVTSTKDNYLFVNVFALTCLFRQIKRDESDKANVCTLASALINSQPLSALPRLHFEIPKRLTALPRLHLKIANQVLESPAVCTFASAKKRYTVI